MVSESLSGPRDGSGNACGSGQPPEKMVGGCPGKGKTAHAGGVWWTDQCMEREGRALVAWRAKGVVACSVVSKWFRKSTGLYKGPHLLGTTKREAIFTLPCCFRAVLGRLDLGSGGKGSVSEASLSLW